MQNGRSLVLSKIGAHIDNIALHHSIFALPFAYMGAFLAANGKPAANDLIWITVAMVGARSAALALDNLIDLKFDKLHPRFVKRPMVTGAVKPWEAIALIIFSFIVFVYAVCQLKPICIKLLPLAAMPFIIYPYTKRFTFACHGVLGLAIAMAPAGGWVAVRGTIDWPMIILCSAVGMWIGSFDAVYGAQDEAFDRQNGLHSLATKFGAAGALKIARFFHGAAILLFTILGVVLKLSWPYYIGIVIAGLTLVYQHSIVNSRDFSRLTQVYFMRNGIVSIAMFICTWISYYIK